MKETVYLTTADLADRYRKSVRTIERWRSLSVGPPYTRVGRECLYPLDKVEQYDDERYADTG